MAEKIALSELLDEMELTDSARGLTRKTLIKNRKLLQMFFNFIDSEYSVQTLPEVKAVHIRQFLVHKMKEGCAETYTNTFLRAIRAFFIFCEVEEYISQVENPCLRVKWVQEPQVLIRAWSDDDVKKMLDYTKKEVMTARKRVNRTRGTFSLFVAERNRLMIMLLADTGLRISELENLRDSTFDRDSIFVLRGKGKKDRVVYSSPMVYQQKIRYDRIKAKYFENREVKQEDYVFLTKLGKKLSNDMAQRYVKRIGEAAGCDKRVRMSPHTFRHYFTQTLLNNGADIYTIQRLLGHASIKTTETYLRSLESKKVISQGLDKSPLMNLH